MENQVVKYQPQSGGIEIYNRMTDPLSAIEKLGTWFAKSGMFGCERVEQGQVLAMECLATNKPPSVISRTYHIMDGKLSKKALAALAEFRAAGGKHKWVKDGSDGKEAAIELTMDGNTITSRFTIEDAKQMGVSFKPGSGWVKAASNMLRARAISNGVAMLAPEIYAGDVEEEPEPRAAEPLLPQTKTETKVTAPPAAAPETKKEPAPAVVEAEIVGESKPATAAAITPEQSASPAANSSAQNAMAERFIAEVTPEGRLTAATQAKIIELVGEDNMSTALTWLIARGKIPKDGNLSQLRRPVAQDIIDRTPTFKTAVGIK